MREPRMALLLLGLGCGGDPKAPWLTDPGVDGHAQFLLLAGTPHDPTVKANNISCNSCHSSDTFAKYDCTTSCHTPATTDPLHSGISGYTAGRVTSADCRRCHPNGTGAMTPEQHAVFFPIGTASHPAVCSQCHTDLLDRRNLDKLNCAGCHAGRPGFASKHVNVRDYPVTLPVTAAAPWCLRCHADDQVDRVASHGLRPGPHGNGGPSDGNHGSYCFPCHTMVPPLPLFGGAGPGIPSRPWAQDWSIATCSNCH